MSKSRNIHVTPRSEGGWQVVRDHADRVSSVHDRKADAVDAGRSMAKSERGELFIHGENGRIQDRDSYGNDPFPPRDTKH